uniref:Uncharacterized protein 5 n=1 Tax=Halisarca dujardinii TaxID=2583056 RepID=A0AA96S2Y4_HALDU|nr:uncharacterized protein 5 [Halisarca dujardinii]
MKVMGKMLRSATTASLAQSRPRQTTTRPARRHDTLQRRQFVNQGRRAVALWRLVQRILKWIFKGPSPPDSSTETTTKPPKPESEETGRQTGSEDSPDADD